MMQIHEIPRQTQDAFRLADHATWIIALAGMYSTESADVAVTEIRSQAAQSTDPDEAVALYAIARAVETLIQAKIRA
jgi:hypothetical protein